MLLRCSIYGYTARFFRFSTDPIDEGLTWTFENITVVFATGIMILTTKKEKYFSPFPGLFRWRKADV